MTTFNTGNPIGSTDARDRSDNSENLDLAVNSLALTFKDRLGRTRDTLEGIYQKSAYYRAGTFDAGYTLTNNRQTLAYGNVEYSWSGAFPKAVAAGSTPATSGGVGAGAWIDRTQDTLRSQLLSDSGAQLVFHKSSINGAIKMSLSDSIDLQPINPEMFGADGTVAGDTAAMIAAFAFAYLNPCKIELSRIYNMNQPATCYYVQTHNKGFALVGKHKNCGISWQGTDTVNSTYVIDVHGYNPVISTIRLQEDSAAKKINTGVRLCGEGVLAEDVVVRGRWRHGVLGIACLKGSRFNRIDGSLMPNGTNVTALEGVPLQLSACVNVSVHQLLSNLCEYPIAISGVYDSASTLTPPSYTSTITWGCEGVTVSDSVGVFTKYGPRLGGIEIQCSGSVWDLIYDKFCFIDGTAIKVQRCWFGANSATPTTVNAFPKWDTGGANVSFVNNTISMGAATALTTPTTASSTFSHAYADFSGNHLENFQCYVNSANRCSAENNIAFVGSTPDVTQLTPDAHSTFIAQQRKSRLCQGLILGQNTPDGDGKLQIRADSGQRLFNGLTPTGVIMSTCPGGLGVTATTPASSAVLYLGSITSTGRSINATGTINASGADYAEYMKKSDGCGIIEKGQIVGINKNGELTDKFDESIKFAIKSTNPSIVGGNIPEWDAGYPEMPNVSEPVKFTPERRYGQSDEDFAVAVKAADDLYNAELSVYHEEIEAYNLKVKNWQLKYDEARAPYDRVAFCGRVQCCVLGAPGDYVIPTRNNDGGIGAACESSPDFEQYIKSVGIVIESYDDNSVVAVKFV